MVVLLVGFDVPARVQRAVDARHPEPPELPEPSEPSEPSEPPTSEKV